MPPMRCYRFNHHSSITGPSVRLTICFLRKPVRKVRAALPESPNSSGADSESLSSRIRPLQLDRTFARRGSTMAPEARAALPSSRI